MPLDTKAFLEGPAGAGKTTAAVQRLLQVIKEGIPGGSILVLVPQRTLATPYSTALRRTRVRAGGVPSILTAGGLARRMVELFWPLAAGSAGFAEPDRPPIFLTLETAQYHMARLVRPLRQEEGYFDSVVIDDNRLYSQILDNLNKAAVVGFPSSEIGPRLAAAWSGEPTQLRVYADAQVCATRFHEHCLANNLLDFSLQVEVFWRQLWPLPQVREHILGAYRHLIADNIEEDTPFTHDLLRDVVPELDSALLIYDQDAGYRQFLGADPQSAYLLRDLCQVHVAFDKSFVTSPALRGLGDCLAEALDQPRPHTQPPAPYQLPSDTREALLFTENLRFYPQMLDWTAGEIAVRVEEGTSPGEIVVLAPFLSDALRFSLMNRLERLGIPARSHRPSRALRDEPATHALLTLAALAHPQWATCPGRFDVSNALLQGVDELDLVARCSWLRLFTGPRTACRSSRPGRRSIPTSASVSATCWAAAFDTIRLWLSDYARKAEQPLDHFLSRLFGEILSQHGHGFHDDFDAPRVAANLVESVQKFRQGMGGEWVPPKQSPPQAGSPATELTLRERSLGKEYLELVEDGVIAAQYIGAWQEPEDTPCCWRRRTRF